MSTIIAKAFDATKKVVRTVFKGAPNLFTTSDLNRQIEATKYYMDALQIFAPVKCPSGSSAITASCSYDGEHLQCNIAGGAANLNVAGVTFSGITEISYSESFSIVGDKVHKRLFVGIAATQRELSFNDDPDHSLVGAKFSDNTSRPAANQIVYENVAYVVGDKESVLANQNLIGIFAVVDFYATTPPSSTNSASVTYNCTDSPILSEEGKIKGKLLYSSEAELTDGIGYSEAFYRLQNNIKTLNTFKSKFGVFDVADLPEFIDSSDPDGCGIKLSYDIYDSVNDTTVSRNVVLPFKVIKEPYRVTYIIDFEGDNLAGFLRNNRLEFIKQPYRSAGDDYNDFGMNVDVVFRHVTVGDQQVQPAIIHHTDFTYHCHMLMEKYDDDWIICSDDFGARDNYSGRDNVRLINVAPVGRPAVIAANTSGTIRLIVTILNPQLISN